MVEKEELKGSKMDRRTSRFKRICVFCGSSSGKKMLYRNVALDLGKEMVKRKIDLVYGGGSIGLMGQIAQTVHDGGGHVIGVIPKALMAQEISGKTVGELRAVSDMHERKAEMARQADAFIALPGGYGTLEELLEMITWVQLGIHDKPVGLLNVDGYYNSLLALFDKAVEEGFLQLSARNILLSAPTARELLEKFETAGLSFLLIEFLSENGKLPVGRIRPQNDVSAVVNCDKDYEPKHERVVSRGSWEVDMRKMDSLGYNAKVNC